MISVGWSRNLWANDTYCFTLPGIRVQVITFRSDRLVKRTKICSYYGGSIAQVIQSQKVIYTKFSRDSIPACSTRSVLKYTILHIPSTLQFSYYASKLVSCNVKKSYELQKVLWGWTTLTRASQNQVSINAKISGLARNSTRIHEIVYNCLNVLHFSKLVTWAYDEATQLIIK